MRRRATLCAAALLLGGTQAAQAPDAKKPDPHQRRIGDELRRLQRLVARQRGVLLHAPSVQEALSLAAVVYGVPRWQLASVAYCESTARANAFNGRSGATGLFQWLPSSWASSPFGRAGLSAWSPYASALAAAERVTREGSWGAWVCRP